MAAFYFEINKEEKKKRLIKENKETESVNEETINEKIEKIEKETESIVSVFEKRKELIRIDGMKTEEEIYDIIFKELNEREFVSPGGHNIIFLMGDQEVEKVHKVKEFIIILIMQVYLLLIF